MVMVLFAFPMFLLVNTGSLMLIVITVVIAYAVCQNSLAGAQGPWFPELFEAKTRASGASMAYQFSAVVSGFTPFVVTLLYSAYGWVGAASLFGLYGLIGLVATLVTAETWGPAQRQAAQVAVAPTADRVAGHRLISTYDTTSTASRPADREECRRCLARGRCDACTTAAVSRAATSVVGSRSGTWSSRARTPPGCRRGGG